jgi:hypothetical protein
MPSYCGCVRRTDIARQGKSRSMLLSPSVASHALGAALLAHLDPMRTCAFAAVEAEVTQWRDPIVSSVEDPALAVIVEGCDPADGRISDSEPDSNHHFEKQCAKRHLERIGLDASGSCSALSFGSSLARGKLSNDCGSLLSRRAPFNNRRNILA